jgi:predicted Rossmann fold nucleotide-binding protein DprA/Smf involved in DNA uptake
MRVQGAAGMVEQIATVRQTLGREAMTLDALSAHFTAPGTTTPLIVEALAALEELGMVERVPGDRYRMAG